MKVLIVNKFFYPRGGDCVVAMGTRRILQNHGHTVKVFAMSYPDNIDIAEKDDFATRADFSGGIRKKAAGAMRTMGLGDIRKSAERIIDSFRPDVIHLHNIHSYLSPLIGEIAHKRGIRVVWTLHDYKLLCPAYACRRPSGENCDSCITDPFGVLKHRCMKGSLLQSATAWIESRVWNRKRLINMTDCFIAPSSFMANKLMEAGYPGAKIKHLSNCIDNEKMEIYSNIDPAAEREDYFCYVGRLSEEKGVPTMIEAASRAGVKLKVAGTGPLLADMKIRYGKTPGIEFLGHLDRNRVAALLSKAKASVMPSECNENNPMGVIESLAAGTPVIGANIGGIPELIGEREGILFTSGNTDQLTTVFRNFDKRHPFDHTGIAGRARNRFDEKTHYQELMKLYMPE